MMMLLVLVCIWRCVIFLFRCVIFVWVMVSCLCSVGVCWGVLVMVLKSCMFSFIVWLVVCVCVVLSSLLFIMMRRLLVFICWLLVIMKWLMKLFVLVWIWVLFGS